jgi:hypothetical protein
MLVIGLVFVLGLFRGISRMSTAKIEETIEVNGGYEGPWRCLTSTPPAHF